MAEAEARAASEADVKRIWHMREGVSKSLQLHGAPHTIALSTCHRPELR